jgi:hypothetical protein
MHASHWTLILGVLVVIAPELAELRSVHEAMEWGHLWHLIHVGAGAALVRLSGHQWEKRNGKVEGPS